ncbi:MAG: ATP-binding protein [Boseongicola sp. SB0677_bin_26]|nr:ATP-binding protein [Boseongicola sp. SB0665_bin_10]MYG25020.1 ATP-binding protein [Boseongicola sp. SB0677_bin_26]
MADIDLEGLLEFSTAGDREAPPYFAGRADVLRDVGRAAERCWDHWTDGRGKTPGATRVIYGAPGAGKSSVLMHLERSWTGPGGGAPVMLRLGAPADFEDGRTFAERLVNLLRPGKGAEIRTEISRTWNLQGNLPGVGGQLGRESRTGIPDDPINAVLSYIPAETWTSPVVIAVDEFQAASGDETAPHAKVLHKLHTHDYEAPIMAVLAGLSNTLGTVDRLGISRRSIDASYSLGCLEPEESEDLADGWSAHFGLPKMGPLRTAMLAQVEAGSHWPAHARNALASFAEEIARVQGDITLVDMQRVATGAHERRQKYYQSRMSDEMWNSKWLLGAVVADLWAGADSGDVINLVNRHADPASNDVKWRMPEGMSARDFYHHILHRGVVQQETDSTVSRPIPSFRDWIIENCMPRPFSDADADSDPYAIPDPCTPPTPFD